METLHLGKTNVAYASPDEARLDPVPNPHRDLSLMYRADIPEGEKLRAMSAKHFNPYVARFVCPEFTSLCPVTGQPDFATIVIDYIPADFLVESKSLKLFMHSFRNHGAFHEDCTITIGKRIFDAVSPIWLRVGGYWYPRGGIPIDVFWQSNNPPPDVWIPPQEVPTYRAR